MGSTGEELERLSGLLEKGLITREEFDQEKRKLLSGGGTTTSRPSTLGSYRITGEIGVGGMGRVYQGRHRTAEFASRQDGEVAIKVLHPQYAERADIVERFEREAALGIKLDHPGVVRVHELVVDGGRVALVMELVEGRPLSEVIGHETGPIPWARAEPMFVQLLDAVSYAHAHGVVHRDLKPENVMVGPGGKLKILDFGIAKDMESGRTKTGTGMGTVDYMAPEQYIDAKAVDARADIYALGMTLYEMLAGRLPWDAETSEFEVLKRKETGQIPPPTEFYPDIPPEVVPVVMRMLRPGAGERYGDCGEIGQALEAAKEQVTKREAAAREAAEKARKEREEAKKKAEAAEAAREAEKRAAEAAREEADRAPMESTSPVTPDSPPGGSRRRSAMIVAALAVLGLGGLGILATGEGDRARKSSRSSADDDDDGGSRGEVRAPVVEEGATSSEGSSFGPMLDDVVDLSRELPTTGEIPQFLKSVSSTARKSGLTVLRYRPVSEEPRPEGLSRVPVEFVATGRYHEHAHFLDVLSRFDQLVYLEDIHLGDPEARGFKVYVKMTGRLVTYRYLSEAEVDGERKGPTRAVADQLRAEKVRGVRMLDELAKAAPEKLRLLEVDENKGQILLVGRASSNETISQFLSSLEESSFLDEVYLSAIDQVEEEDIKVKEFSVTARMSSPKATGLENFTYDSNGKRDPFMDFLGLVGGSPEAAPLTPLQRYELDEYELEGIISGLDRPRALFEDPAGVGHVVEVDDYIGRNWGKICEIGAFEVVVCEEYQTIDGELVTNRVQFHLPQEDDGE